MNSRSHDHANAPNHRDALDELLARDWLQTPPDFTQRVMQRLPWQAEPAGLARPRRAFWQRLRWLLAAAGLLGSGVLGLSQLAGFVFGLWLASSAV